MDTVQELRRRAQTAGNLQSGEQMTVQQQGPAIVIQPATPQYVYVPYYDPMVVYGTWWWPAYRPVYWAPWPGYARPYHPGVPAGFWWGRPTGLSLNFFFGNCDWHRRQVRVVHVNNYYYRPAPIMNRTAVVDRGHWQHQPRSREVLVERRPRAQDPVQPPARAVPVVDRREQRHDIPGPARMERREARHEHREPRHGPRNEPRAAGRQRS
jgi:hypothetical protein